MVRDVKTEQDFQQLLADSRSRPVFLFKHSTSCPISGRAWKLFSQFVETCEEADFWRVLVIENRPLSQWIADQTGIWHESPQVILFHRGRPVWHESHFGITEKALKKALEKVRQTEAAGN